MNTLQEVAARWWAAGATPLPVRTSGSKAPNVKAWKELQQRRPTQQELGQLLAVDHDGIGVVTGNVSGRLEMIELEGRAVQAGMLVQVAEVLEGHDATNLWRRLTTGCSEVTPGGGLHFYYRVSDADALPNRELACRPATAEELHRHKAGEMEKALEEPDDDRRNKRIANIDALTPERIPQVLIETRGEGGFSVVAPSAGRTHPSGRPWVQVAGGPETIPVITAAERDLLHDLCRLLDQMPDKQHPTQTASANTGPGASSDGERPGDQYARETDWADILVPQGWRQAWRRGNLRTWVRPGKEARDGISATTGRNDGDNMWVFTTATSLPDNQPLTKFWVYAHYEHGGDMSAAASALRKDGFGAQQEQVTLTLLPSDPIQQSVTSSPPMTDGTAALAPVTQLHPVRVVEDNEDALARAFVVEVAESVRYVPQHGKWLTWSGSSWEWDEVGRHRELIKDVARRLPATSKTAQAFRRRMLSSAGISGVANMARTDPSIVVHLDRLDAQPWELNTPAGVVDLRTGTISPPDPAKLHTRSTSVAPDFTMPAPRWLQFLSDTFGGDQELISYVQRLLGVAAVGEVLEQALPVGHGVGANGKSVFVETCTDVLGRGERGYAIAANPEMLMARKFQEHPTELAQLAGARLVVCSELEDGARFAEARVKQLTGRDSISARFMKRDFFTFTPSHTFLLVANHRPQATVGGPAFWRRLRLIPFQHVVPEERRDPHLPEKLRAEWPAILAWIIMGAADYAQGGMRTPQMVLAATEQYARDEDSMGRFVAEQCHLAPGSDLVRVRTAKLRTAYEQMCRELGYEPVSARRFTQELRDRFGITSARTGAHRFSVGIALVDGDDDVEVSPDEPEVLL